MELSDEKVAELKAKYGELSRIDAGEHAVVVKRITEPEYVRAVAMATGDDPVAKSAAAKIIVSNAVVYPEKPELGVMLSEFPGLADTFATEILKLAGATLKATSKKL